MPRPKPKPRPIPAPTPLDLAAAVCAERAARVAECEQAVDSALAAILPAYHCRLVTYQEIINGQPGPVQIKVSALE